MWNVTKCYAQTQNFLAFEKLVDKKCQWIKSPSSGIEKFHTMSTNTFCWKSLLHTRLIDTAIARYENEVYTYIE